MPSTKDKIEIFAPCRGVCIMMHGSFVVKKTYKKCGQPAPILKWPNLRSNLHFYSLERASSAIYRRQRVTSYYRLAHRHLTQIGFGSLMIRLTPIAKLSR